MAKLIVFNNVSLDGYFSGPGGDIAWMKGRRDAEFDEFVAGNAAGGGALLFGRITYELMAEHWTRTDLPAGERPVAGYMSGLEKRVFSRTLREATWANTTLVKGGLAEEVRRMKASPGDDMAILGSGTLVSQLAADGLIDEYQCVIVPVILGRGRTMFEGLLKPVALRLKESRSFRNGNVFVSYEPAR